MNHMGGLGSGHYTSYAKNLETKKWYIFNDNMCHEIDESKIATKDAYILFFKRIPAKKYELVEMWKERRSQTWQKEATQSNISAVNNNVATSTNDQHNSVHDKRHEIHFHKVEEKKLLSEFDEQDKAMQEAILQSQEMSHSRDWQVVVHQGDNASDAQVQNTMAKERNVNIRRSLYVCPYCEIPLESDEFDDHLAIHSQDGE